MKVRPLRVALVCGGYAPREDGVSDYVRRLMGALGERVEPILVTRAPVEAPVGWRTIASRHDWRAEDVVNVARDLRHACVDLVHVQYAPVAFRWRRAVRLLPVVIRGLLGRVPVIVTAHEFEREMLALLTRADAVVATTTEHANRLVDASPALEARMSIVPIGPNIAPAGGDPLRLREGARMRWDIPLHAPLVVFFGFLHPVKGLEYLVRAMVRVRDGCPGARLVVAGGARSLALPGAEGDAYHAKLMGLIRELGLGHTVALTGYLEEEDVSALLYAADVVALPFTYGTSFKSGSLLAALAHGRAVVGTCARAADPRLTPGEHLLCVPPRDADSLASAILTLLLDQRLRERLARAGADAARAFNWTSIADQHLELYARVCTAVSDGAPDLPGPAAPR